MSREEIEGGDRDQVIAGPSVRPHSQQRSSTMWVVAMVAIGAAVGANLRYFISAWAAQAWGGAFPYGTLLINVAGSFVIGIVMVILTSRAEISPLWRPLVVTGLLGGFTTFSTFSYETYVQLVGGSWLLAALNIFGSVGLGLAGVMFGVALARLFVPL